MTNPSNRRPPQSISIRLADLTSIEVQALARMDDGFPADDSVGALVDETPQKLLPASVALCVMGLAEMVEGWGGLQWFMLTEAGRRIRGTGK